MLPTKNDRHKGRYSECDGPSLYISAMVLFCTAFVACGIRVSLNPHNPQCCIACYGWHLDVLYSLSPPPPAKALLERRGEGAGGQGGGGLV